MADFVRVYFLQLKRLFLRPSFVIEMGVILVLLVIVRFISLPEVTNLAVCYSGNSDAIGEYRGSFEFYELESPDRVREEVLSGKADCGFIFEDDDITCVTTPFSLKSDVAAESVFAEVFKDKSADIISEKIELLYPENGEEYSKEVIIKRQELLEDSELFGADITLERVSGDFSPDIRLILKIAVIVLALCYILISERKRQLFVKRGASVLATVTPVLVMMLV